MGGVFANPAGIIGNHFTTDINAIAGNAGITTNAIGLRLFADSGDKRYAVLDYAGAKELYANFDVYLPSFVAAIDEVQAIGITTRARVVAGATGVSNELFRFMAGDTARAPTVALAQLPAAVNVHAFVDIGASYARILFENDEHIFKFGATAKLYLGLAAGSLRVRDGELLLLDNNTVGHAGGTFEAVYSDGFNRVYDGKFSELKPEAFGFGMDFGIVYEWKDMRYPIEEDETRYKLRVGIAVTDIGSLKYKTAPHAATYRVDIAHVKQYDLLNRGFASMSEYVEYMKSKGYFATEDEPVTLRAPLPAYLRVTADYNAGNNFFVNLRAGVSLASAGGRGATYAGMLTLAPRWEHRDISLYSPVGYAFATRRLSWGVGVNTDYIFIGSGNLFSNLLSKNLAAMDVYVGIHVPLGGLYAKPAVKAKPVPVREGARW